VSEPPQIRVFTVERATLDFGEATTLVWIADHAEQVLLRYPGSEERVDSSGSRTVEPRQSTAYTLVAQNRLGETTQTVQIQVNPTFATPTPQATATPQATFMPVPALEPAIESAVTPTEMAVEATGALPTTGPGLTLLPITGTAPTTEEAADPLPQAAAEIATEITAETVTETAQAEMARAQETASSEAAIGETVEERTEGTLEAPAVALIPPIATAIPAPEPDMMPLAAAPEGPPATARMRLLALLGGGVLILGAPLLFAFIWMIVWSAWRRA
jgi:hypothetical protein